MDHPYSMKLASTGVEVQRAQRIRHQVFVAEQGIPAGQDKDGLDGEAFHALVSLDGEAVATGRLVVKGDGVGVLARIAVLPGHRGQGLGKRVVEFLEEVAVGEGLREVSLCPHRYLEKFYEGLGYETVGGTSAAGRHELITMRKSLRR